MDDYDIQMTKTMEGEVSAMCNLSQGIEEKGRAETILSNIRSFLKSMDLSAEPAMTALGVPGDERQKYMDMLGQ